MKNIFFPKILIFFSIYLTSIATFATIVPLSKIKKTLGPYPSRGSAEEIKDVNLLLFYQNNRTAEDCRKAQIEAKNQNLKTFFAGENGPLTKNEAKKLKLIITKPFVESGIYSWITKELVYKRPRPYETFSEIQPCISLTKTKSYPSGHTTMARYYARILSAIYPERANDFMKRADEIAMNRIIGGVHYPSDVLAGKKLGDLIADTALKDKKFLRKIGLIK
jgi:acid phosphatase (class A)